MNIAQNIHFNFSSKSFYPSLMIVRRSSAVWACVGENQRAVGAPADQTKIQKFAGVVFSVLFQLMW